ncbi:hypothetical protein TNCV_1660291 [Trichonephila clavipes]|nr:hypothetical protein TNCV_1660291 [Trichonephila clavipes]
MEKLRQSFFRKSWKSLRTTDWECPRKQNGKFYEKAKFQAVSFAIGTTNNKARQVSICTTLQTIDSVVLPNVWNELDYRLNACRVTRELYTAGQLLRTDNTIIHSNHKMKGCKMWKIRISAGY